MSGLDIGATEALIIGAVLKFGSPVASYMLQNGLTADKFSSKHESLWRNITESILQNKVEPTSINVSRNPQQLATCNWLYNELAERFNIHTVEQLDLESLGTKIHTAGSLRAASGPIWQAGHQLEDLDTLVGKVDSAGAFLGGLAADLYEAEEQLQTGYVPISQVAESVRTEFQRMRKGESTRILGCGWPSLRMRNLFPLGSMSVVHGLPSAGKTQFALQVLLGSAIQLVANKIQGCVVFNSLEMSKDSLGIRLACLLTGIDFTCLENNSGPSSNYDRLDKALYFIETLPILLSDEPSLTTDMLGFQLGVLQLAQGPVWQVVTDYGQLFGDKAQSEERRVGTIFREQKRLANKLGFSLLALSQDTQDKTDQYRISSSSSLRYSAEIEQAADVIALVWNPVVLKAKGEKFKVRSGLNSEQAWIMVQKYRNGKVGEFALNFDLTCGRFSDPANGAALVTQSAKLYDRLVERGDTWEII